MLPCLCLLVVRYFDNMLELNLVFLWRYMIAGYALNGKDEEASDFTFSTVLLICANITTYDQGKQVHILTINMDLIHMILWVFI